jgi:hypothetical protein
MKTNPLHRLSWLLMLHVALGILAAGCASPDEHSYNQDYNQNLTTAPKYYIKNVDDTHFKVIVHQGSPSTGAQRVIDVKQVASVVAGTEAKHRDWPSWKLDYIQERNQGWMHIVIAEVTRENAVEYQPDASGK